MSDSESDRIPPEHPHKLSICQYQVYAWRRGPRLTDNMMPTSAMKETAGAALYIMRWQPVDDALQRHLSCIHSSATGMHHDLRRGMTRSVQVIIQCEVKTHLQVQFAPVEADGLDRSPCCEEDSSPGCLIDPSRLHAHKAALHDINSADAVVSSHLHREVASTPAQSTAMMVTAQQTSTLWLQAQALSSQI